MLDLSVAWERSDVRFVLPRVEVETMFRHARRFGLAQGGRFQVQNERTVLLWSAAPTLATAADPRPVAAFAVQWDRPSADAATIREVGWDVYASSEEEVWRAIDLLLRGISTDAADAGPP